MYNNTATFKLLTIVKDWDRRSEDGARSPGNYILLFDELSDLGQRPPRIMIGAALFKRRSTPASNGGRTQSNNLLAHRIAAHPAVSPRGSAYSIWHPGRTVSYTFNETRSTGTQLSPMTRKHLVPRPFRYESGILRQAGSLGG